MINGQKKMVGGGNRRDEGSFTVNSTNVFAALDTLRKKKRSDKEKGTSKGSKSSTKAGKSKAAEEKQVYWAPAPLTVKSWADVEDDDDDDFYATTAPPQAVWGSSGLSKAKERQKPVPVEESESEDDLLDEYVEEEADHETEVQEQAEPVVTKPVEVSQAPKETERQLSKKERKKKELAELEAILADFGVNPKEKSENEPSEISKEGQQNGDAEKKEIAAPAESKSARKKKKKEKASKESKEPQKQPNSSDAQEENAKEVEEGGVVTVPFKKVVPSLKKKKSNKEMDAAARAAALEAAARSAKLAAAKKKEKNHYNQQPMR